MIEKEFFLQPGDLVRLPDSMWLVVSVKRRKEENYFDVMWYRLFGKKDMFVCTTTQMVNKTYSWIEEITRISKPK